MPPFSWCSIIEQQGQRKEVENKDFRSDLYYRLNVIHIKMPSLNDRPDDIPILAQHFLETFRKELGKEHIKKISTEAMQYLMKYTYPGNVRELENIIERAVALEKTDIVLPESLPVGLTNQDEAKSEVYSNSENIFDVPATGLDLERLIGDIEKEILVKALDMSGGVKKEAAKLLNISFRSLRYRLSKYEIN